jgi:UDP-GlcNAc:undecaprenyl-phosphate GlcNAc-1-phosphate transferase
METGILYAFYVLCSFFLLSVLFSFQINRLLLRFVRTLGIRNTNDTVIRWGSQSKPSVGGLSFYILFLLSIITFAVTFDSSQVFLNKEFIGLLLATMLGFLLGLADDAYDTRPVLKLLTQITCGVILMVTGTQITISYLEPVNYLITIFWVVGIMNSLNMLDNMDAISTTVSISIILSVQMTLCFHDDFNSVYFMILTGVLGALTGFLYFNWHPSKIYMGDTGSQFLGVFLAAIGIKYLWNSPVQGGDMISARNFFLPLMVFLLPIIDTTTVTINRLLAGRSPFIGGKDHTTHSLGYLGLSDRQVAIVFAVISLLSVFIVYMIERFLARWDHVYTAIFSAYFLAIFSLFYYASRVAQKNR